MKGPDIFTHASSFFFFLVNMLLASKRVSFFIFVVLSN